LCTYIKTTYIHDLFTHDIHPLTRVSTNVGWFFDFGKNIRIWVFDHFQKTYGSHDRIDIKGRFFAPGGGLEPLEPVLVGQGYTCTLPLPYLNPRLQKVRTSPTWVVTSVG
jgi:hypothetical protein